MRKYIICMGILLSFNYCFSQPINYEKTFKGALAKAAAQNKPLFILLMPPNIEGRPEIMPSPLNAKGETVDFYNKNFISFKASVLDTTGTKIRATYNLHIFPALVFLDSKGNLLFKEGGAFALVQQPLALANKVLSRISEGKTLSDYDNLLKSGKMDRRQMEEYITMRQELEIFDNADLADKYVEMLTVKDLNDYNTVLFLLKMGPYAYGKTYSLAYTNKAITDSIYKREPFEVRKAINDRMIVNSRVKAAKDKDIRLATNTATIRRISWGENFREGQKSYTDEMLNYYKAVKDTANYYSMASYFFDQNYLNISADSAKKLQNKTLEALKMPEAVKEQLQNQGTNNTGTVTRLVAVPAGDDVSWALNNGAYTFYTLGTKNINLLVKALIWSRRSIELRPLPEYYDTMAHIMYRMNFKDEAILNQTKAIEMAKNQILASPERITFLQNELAKMKASTL